MKSFLSTLTIAAMLIAFSTATASADRYSWRPDSSRDYNSGIYSNGYNNNYRIPNYGTYYRGYGNYNYGTPYNYGTYYGPGYVPYNSYYGPQNYQYNYQYQYQNFPYPSYQYQYHYNY